MTIIQNQGRMSKVKWLLNTLTERGREEIRPAHQQRMGHVYEWKDLLNLPHKLLDIREEPTNNSYIGLE